MKTKPETKGRSKEPSRQGASTPAPEQKQGHKPGRRWWASRTTIVREPGSRGRFYTYRGKHTAKQKLERVTTSFFRNQTSILLLNSISTSVFSWKSGAQVLLSPILCWASLDGEVFWVWFVLWHNCETETLSIATVQIISIYIISTSSPVVNNNRNLIHCFLCCLGNRDSIPMYFMTGIRNYSSHVRKIAVQAIINCIKSGISDQSINVVLIGCLRWVWPGDWARHGCIFMWNKIGHQTHTKSPWAFLRSAHISRQLWLQE